MLAFELGESVTFGQASAELVDESFHSPLVVTRSPDSDPVRPLPFVYRFHPAVLPARFGLES